MPNRARYKTPRTRRRHHALVARREVLAKPANAAINECLLNRETDSASTTGSCPGKGAVWVGSGTASSQRLLTGVDTPRTAPSGTLPPTPRARQARAQCLRSLYIYRGSERCDTWRRGLGRRTRAENPFVCRRDPLRWGQRVGRIQEKNESVCSPRETKVTGRCTEAAGRGHNRKRGGASNVRATQREAGTHCWSCP